MAKIDEPGWWAYEDYAELWHRDEIDERKPQRDYTRLVPLPEREALANFLDSALAVPPKDYLRNGTQAEYMADALIAWLKGDQK